VTLRIFTLMDKKINKIISSLRADYSSGKLDKNSIDKDPFIQFGRWMKDALVKKVKEPNAFHLATVNESHQPDVRVVLLRGFNKKGFVFFTNYKSEKGRNITGNAGCALDFFWVEMQRQVRIQGMAKKISAKESDEYFASRPRESQLSAWASAQSTLVENRNVLEEKYKKVEKKYHGKLVPRPPHWGGYRVIPTAFEFWQGRSNRLHDRIVYMKTANGKWKIYRLNP